MKSAYKVAQKWLKECSIKADAGGTSDNSWMQTLWKMIWKLNYPNKIKQFMWRSCRNIHPKKHQLKSRGISIEDCCDQCDLSESSGHILWGCKLASKVWSESRLKLTSFPNQMQEFIELVWEIEERKPDIDWELFAVMAWSLWNHRNAVKHGGQRKNAARITKEITEYMKEIRPENHNPGKILNASNPNGPPPPPPKERLVQSQCRWCSF